MKKEHRGDILAAYDAVTTYEPWWANAIQKVGYKPKDVRYVIRLTFTLCGSFG